MRGNDMRARTTLRLFVVSSAVLLGASLPAIRRLRAEPPSTAAATTLPFQDPHRPMNARIDDLLHRLTLAEKIALLHQFQPAIPRLGMPVFKTGSEALHGLAWTTDRDN